MGVKIHVKGQNSINCLEFISNCVEAQYTKNNTKIIIKIRSLSTNSVGFRKCMLHKKGLFFF